MDRTEKSRTAYILHFAPAPTAYVSVAPCGTRAPLHRTDKREEVNCKRCLAKMARREALLAERAARKAAEGHL